ncbi:MAG: elongation factor P [Patescibacteria group bacterium]
MLKYNELKKGTIFLFEGDPYEVLEYDFLRKQQRRPVAKTKIRNLKNGKVISRNFQQSEVFEEAELEIKNIKFIYGHRGKFMFAYVDNPSQRFELPAEVLGEKTDYLRPNSQVEAILFENNVINIRLPIKMDFKVIECPPSYKGNTAQGGGKTAVIETNAKIEVPMFIKEGDFIRVNTQDHKYIERVSK